MSSLVLEAAGPRGAVTLDARLAVAPGECLALTGPSGSGKTSLLRIVAGLLRPERGRVMLGDVVWLDTARGIARPPERRGCGMVFQDYALWDHLSAWRNVAYGMRATPRRERREGAEAMLGRLGLAGRAGARAADLSGGERQRVALARALAREPAVLLLDEPLGALDARARGEAARVLGAALRETGVPAIIVTHSFAEAALLADRVAVLERGAIAQVGPPGELAAAPVSAWVAELTGASVLLGAATRDADGGTRVRLEGGGEVVATDGAEPGPVAVSIHPWEVTLEPAGSAPHGSARNRLPVEVVSVTELGPRVRVGLAAPQLLAAEVTIAAARELGLRPGTGVVATWKAAATRVLPR